MKIFIGSIFSMLAALAAFAQSPAGAPVRVSLQVAYHAYLLPEGAYVPAPADMFIHPILDPLVPMHAGDTVTIDFFGDGKKILSAKAAWHDATPHMVPGQAQPAYILPAQFMVPNCVWTNVSQGSHTVTIRAHGLQGFSASAGPVHFTVLPPIPPQPPKGAHTLTGKQRPPVKPESVKVFRVTPQGTHEVVGKVTAQVSGTWPDGTQDALAEMREQAAQLGANGVIIDNVNHSDGMPFSGPNKIFTLPEIRMTGRAIYLAPTQ